MTEHKCFHCGAHCVDPDPRMTELQEENERLHKMVRDQCREIEKLRTLIKMWREIVIVMAEGE